MAWRRAVLSAGRGAKCGRVGKSSALRRSQPGRQRQVPPPACADKWTTYDDPRLHAYPAFDPFVLSADLIFPIVSLDQDTRWTPTAKAVTLDVFGLFVIALPAWLPPAIMWIEIAYGWIAGLILAAVFSGIINRK